jgi:hypothetical protein
LGVRRNSRVRFLRLAINKRLYPDNRGIKFAFGLEHYFYFRQVPLLSALCHKNLAVKPVNGHYVTLAVSNHYWHYFCAFHLAHRHQIGDCALRLRWINRWPACPSL